MSDRSTPPRILRTISVTPEDRKWDELAEQMRMDALPRIRGTAERWTSTVSAITGLFGLVALVKGREDITSLRSDWRIIAGVLIALALLIALTSIVFAAFAAQGTPRRVEILSGAAVKELYQHGTHIARRQLAWSRISAVVAVLVLGLAIGITWYGPTTAASTSLEVMVVSRSGMTACGRLSVENHNIAVRPTSTAARDPAIPLQRVALIAPVTSCP
jgi:hypothetical protein